MVPAATTIGGDLSAMVAVAPACDMVPLASALMDTMAR